MLKLNNRRKPIDISINEEGCHLLVGRNASEDGHVRIRVDGKYRFAHRLSYEQEYGVIPDGLIVRHKCDNPDCINPNHLELGTHEDNVRDRVERGRSANGIKNGRAKLTENEARFIKYNEEISINGLAEMFNVSKRAITLIKSGKNWSNI